MTGREHMLGLVASQLEAASTLMKFAADDLNEILVKNRLPLADEMAGIVRTLQIQASTLDGNAAFCRRMGEADEDEDDRAEDQRQATFGHKTR